MPKIEVSRRDLLSLARIGEDPGDQGIEELLTPLKAELDRSEGDLLKVELNDTNRPDLWCVEGIARALRCLRHGREDHLQTVGAPPVIIEADPGIEEVRPYIAGFRATGYRLDEEGLAALIAAQEKLADSFGRSRRTAAIGFHRAEEVEWPVAYRPAAPSEKMVPLGHGEMMSLREVLETTEKGGEYAHLLEGMERYPALFDAGGSLFSFPPVLNSDTTGRVRPGDDDLFCDVTGTDWETVQLTATILACNLEDRGAVITPALVVYPYDVPGGTGEVGSPVRFADRLTAAAEETAAVLGAAPAREETRRALMRMDYDSVDIADDGRVTGVLPPYRRDGIHAVDMIEDLAIALGLDGFEPLLPPHFTVGRESSTARLARALGLVMAGAGFEELMRPVLSSRERLVRLSVTPSEPVPIANPMTGEYGVVRSSILPGLLEAEATSAHAAYPHRLFETGEVLVREPDGTCRSRWLMACLVCDNDADLGAVYSVLGLLASSRRLELSLVPVEDPRFIPGRAAVVLLDGSEAGTAGEVHPAVLDAWGIARPAAAFELDLAALEG